MLSWERMARLIGATVYNCGEQKSISEQPTCQTFRLKTTLGSSAVSHDLKPEAAVGTGPSKLDKLKLVKIQAAFVAADARIW